MITDYFSTIRELDNQLKAWRLAQFMRGYGHGFNLFTSPAIKRNPFYNQGYQSGMRDRALWLAEMACQNLDEIYWSEASVTGEY